MLPQVVRALCLTVVLATIPGISLAACLEPDVLVFYANGIRATAVEADEDRLALQKFLNRGLAEVGHPS